MEQQCGPHINSYLHVTVPVVWHLYLSCPGGEIRRGTSSDTWVRPWTSLESHATRNCPGLFFGLCLKACAEEWDHVWKVNWISWSKNLNNSKAYKCHYLSPISNPDSKARLSLSFKRTGQLSNRKAESSYFLWFFEWCWEHLMPWQRKLWKT